MIVCVYWCRVVPDCPVDELTKEEQAYVDGLAAGPAHDAAVTSRRLVRRLLGSELALAPAQVVIRRNCVHCDGPHGPPRADHQGAPALSVSHSGGWVAVALGPPEERLGLDVEPLSRAPETARALWALEPAASPRDALREWTRKEAVAKLTGLGLRFPFSKLDVTGADVVLPNSVARMCSIAAVQVQGIPAPSGMVAALASAHMVSVRMRRVGIRDCCTDR